MEKKEKRASEILLRKSGWRFGVSNTVVKVDPKTGEKTVPRMIKWWFTRLLGDKVSRAKHPENYVRNSAWSLVEELGRECETIVLDAWSIAGVTASGVDAIIERVDVGVFECLYSEGKPGYIVFIGREDKQTGEWRMDFWAFKRKSEMLKCISTQFAALENTMIEKMKQTSNHYQDINVLGIAVMQVIKKKLGISTE